MVAIRGAGCISRGNMNGIVGVRKRRNGGVFVADFLTVFTLLMLSAGGYVGCFLIGDPLENMVSQGQDFLFGLGRCYPVRCQVNLAVGALEILVVALLGAGGR